MPTFPTPTAIDVAIKIPCGGIRVVASDRADAVVTVSPTSPGREADIRGAEATTVTFDGDRLSIVGPKPRIAVFGPNESIDVLVEVPTGSRLTAQASAGAVRTIGTLGATRLKSGLGPVEVEGTGDLWVRASHGGVTVGTADGTAEITADHGTIRIGSVTGDAVLKASHGGVAIKEAGGAVEAKLSYGDLEIGTARGSVAAKTAYGAIEIDEASAGTVQIESGFGALTVGVRSGVPAWLDLSSKNGHVRNELVGQSAPQPDQQSVAVHARAQYGDITIRRVG